MKRWLGIDGELDEHLFSKEVAEKVKEEYLKLKPMKSKGK